MTATVEKTKEPTVQEICIDLPGEDVRCWRSADNIKVILRKHRDVIFDLKLGDNKTYTVQATESDFYNARDKKLVFAKRREVVTFKDGERLHLWVTRGFKGSLLLKSEGKVLMRVEPNVGINISMIMTLKPKRRLLLSRLMPTSHLEMQQYH